MRALFLRLVHIRVVAKEKGKIAPSLILLQICPVCRKDIRKQKLQPSAMIDSIVKMIVKNKKLSKKLKKHLLKNYMTARRKR